MTVSPTRVRVAATGRAGAPVRVGRARRPAAVPLGARVGAVAIGERTRVGCRDGSAAIGRRKAGCFDPARLGERPRPVELTALTGSRSRPMRSISRTLLVGLLALGAGATAAPRAEAQDAVVV